MRILFDLIYPGYLRYYDRPIKALADRGHDVEVWFVNEKKLPEGLVAIADDSRIHVGGRRPRAEPAHRTVRALRSAGDYLRYTDPRFADARYLRHRAALKLPFGFRWLRHVETLPAAVARRLVAFSLALDRAAPASKKLSAFVAERRPDVVVVGPGVYIGGHQADLLDAARAAGAATVTALASWDNLTTKGLLRGSADRVLVWNEALAEEAADLHQVPRERVRVTGAPNFDKWFGRRPSRSADEFAELVDLPVGTPYILFVGSTARILAPRDELDFVKEWIAALRSSDDPLLREMAVIARPHPHNSLRWEAEELAPLSAATVWPRAGANPVDENDRAEYFDSIYHSAAVVGINTSAMVEAAIIGRPVFTVTPARFAGTQTGTLHFQHLLPENGGFVHNASSIAAHLDQLSTVLRDTSGERERLESFVARFIRPAGMDRDATEVFVAQVESAGEAGPLASPRAGTTARVVLRLFDGLGLGRLDRTFGADDFGRRLSRRAERDRSRFGAAAGPWVGSLEWAARRSQGWRRSLGDDSLDLDV